MSTEDLERMRRFGAYEERERIIKLLENVCKKYGLSEEGYTARLIAAIKGEQK